MAHEDDDDVFDEVKERDLERMKKEEEEKQEFLKKAVEAVYAYEKEAFRNKEFSKYVYESMKEKRICAKTIKKLINLCSFSSPFAERSMIIEQYNKLEKMVFEGHDE